MEISIRQGTTNDLPVVLELIRELAIFEQAPQEVEVSLAELERDFTSSDNCFNFLAAETAGKMVGMALYFYKYSTWKGRCIYLDDIVVNQSFRGMGVGTKLFGELIKLADREKVRKLEWMVLDWNETAISFYEKYPTVFDNEWINCRLMEQQIHELAAMN